MMLTYILMLIIGIALVCGTYPTVYILIITDKLDNCPIGIIGALTGAFMIVGAVLSTIAVNFIGG